MRTFLIKYSYCNLKHENQFKYGNYICINKFFYSNNMISENKYCCNFAIALPHFQINGIAQAAEGQLIIILRWCN